MRRPLLRAAAAVAALLALASPTLGITFGQLDATNQFANVGALIGTYEGNEYLFCTGTLIQDADGGASNIFLTAGHCGDGDGRMSVTFDPTTDMDEATGVFVTGDSVLYEGTFHAHPSFACCGTNDTYDIGVVVLDADVPGVTPAPVASLNLLGTMSKEQLRNATFLTAGYGTVRDDKTRGFASFSFDGDRRFVSQTYQNLLKAWLDLSMQPSTGDGGTCYGDSGGPHFLNGVVVSITSIGDIPCRATDKTYRVDTPVAQDFLAQYLDD
ncbi:MAG TPA: trypsin-like serine protease [Candidatus Limnocylindria bacterium]|nr:trypsin-like serine protease [Candidatus Limnocylindria bacterium]